MSADPLKSHENRLGGGASGEDLNILTDQIAQQQPSRLTTLVLRLSLPIVHLVLALGLLVGGVDARAQNAGPQNAQAQDMGPERLFVPPPRDLLRPLNRAIARIEEKDYRAAIELLTQVLAATEDVDYLSPIPGDPWHSVGVRQQAYTLLGSIPSEYRDEYELQYGSVAQQELRQAVATNDVQAMFRISRKYFFTEAGYTATMLLGLDRMQQDKPAAAAVCFAAIVKEPKALQKFDPEVSVYLASCQLRVGDVEAAQKTLEALRARAPNAQVRYLEQSIALFDQPKKAIQWLAQFNEMPDVANAAETKDWLAFRGNARRSQISGSGGFPMYRPRWYVPTINDPVEESLAGKAWLNMAGRPSNMISSLQPIAVQNTVIYRSTNKVVGIDLGTGKRTWEYPMWDTGELFDDEPKVQSSGQGMQEWHMEQRIWRDHLYGQLASDGKYVFLVEKPGFASVSRQRTVIRGGRVNHDPLSGRQFNELVALDVARQGAFCWEVGGESGGVEPLTAGNFFLGAPLVLDNELLVMAERAGEVSLLSLNPQTGRQNWAQPILAVESVRGIQQDVARRLAGSTPSYSDGVIVCPTSAGGLVAIDYVTKSVLWGVQYSANTMLFTRQQQMRIQVLRQSGQANGIDLTQALDSSVTIADGRLFVTPVDAGSVLCYDLFTGKSLWKIESKDRVTDLASSVSGLYIAFADGNQLVIVGTKKVRAFEATTGKPRWELDLQELGAPSGRGYWAGSHYYLPTSHSKILQINVESGQCDNEFETEQMLGNLICFDGNLVSQSHDLVSTYFQKKPIEEKIAAAFANLSAEEIPVDILRWKAEIESQQGSLSEAVDLAERAYLKSQGLTELHLLMRLINQLVRLDPTIADDYLTKYDNQLKQFNLEDYLISNLIAQVKRKDLDSLFQKFSEYETELSEILSAKSTNLRRTVEPELRVRIDYWLQGVLKRKDEQGKPFFTEQDVQQWLSRNAAEMPVQNLDLIRQLFSIQHVPTDDLTRLIFYKLEQSETSVAFQLVSHALKREDNSQEQQANFLALKCNLLKNNGWTSQASLIAKQLQTDYRDVQVAVAGQNYSAANFGTQMLANLKAEDPSLDLVEWNYGQINEQVQKPRERATRPRGRSLRGHSTLLARSDDAPVGLSVDVNFSTGEFFVYDQWGQLLGAEKYIPKDRTVTRYLSMEQSSYALQGHLMVLLVGENLVVIDLNRMQAQQEALVWHTSVSSGTNTSLRGGSIRVSANNIRRITTRWETVLSYSLDAKGKLLSNLACNSKFVFHRVGQVLRATELATGKLVWERSDVPDSSWLVADEDRVALLRASSEAINGKFSSAVVYFGDSGQLEKSVSLEPHRRALFWDNHGLTLVFTDTGSKEQSLTALDLVSEETVWQRVYPRRTIGSLVAPGTLVTAQPDGNVQYLNYRDGEIEREFKTEISGTVRQLQVQRLKDVDLLYFNRSRSLGSFRDSETGVTVLGLGRQHLFKGDVICFDRKQGASRWTVPVQADYYTVLGSLPYRAPVIALARSINLNTSRSRIRSEVALIDLRDGRLACEVHSAETRIDWVNCQLNPQEQSIKLTLNSQNAASSHVVGLTNQPLPPAPVALLNFQRAMYHLSERDTREQQIAQSRRRQQQLIDEARELSKPKEENNNE